MNETGSVLYQPAASSPGDNDGDGSRTACSENSENGPDNRTGQDDYNNLLKLLRCTITLPMSESRRRSLDEDRLRAIIELDKANINSLRDFTNIVLGQATALTGSSFGYFGLLSDDGHTLNIPSWHRSEVSDHAIGDRALICSVASADSWAEAARTGKISVLNDDVKPDVLKRDYPGGHKSIRRLMSVPIFSEGRLTAVVGVADKDTPYSSEEAEQLSAYLEEAWEVWLRHRNRLSLIESEKKYRLLIETMTEGLCSFDENCRVTYANDHFCRMLGYDRCELVGQSVASFLDEHDAAVFYDNIAHNREAGFKPYEVVWKTKQGADLPAIVSPKALFDSAGNFTGSFAVVTDVSTLKITEAELRRANEMLRREQRALEQKNITLREVLAQIEQERKLMQRQIQTNIDRVVKPIISRLEQSAALKNHQLFELLKTCLDDISSPFINELDRRFARLSPRELEICNLIKAGLSTEAIARTFNTSINTVNNQRKQIRRKLKLSGESANLRMFLQSV